MFGALAASPNGEIWEAVDRLAESAGSFAFGHRSGALAYSPVTSSPLR